MRTILFFVVSMMASHALAQSEVRPSVVLLVPAARFPATEHAEALGLELASRRLALIVRTDETHGSPLERAATAQRICEGDGAIAALFFDERADGTRVRVVDRAGEHTRDAPLQLEADPRSFALVAASLLDELDGSVDPELRVRVDVTVDGHARAGTMQVDGSVDVAASAVPRPVPSPDPIVAPPATPPHPMPTAPPPMVDAGEDDAFEDLPLLPREGFVLEGALQSALIWNGVGAAIDHYVSGSLRLGLVGRIGLVPEEGVGGSLGGRLLFVEREASARFDHGPEIAIVVADGFTGGLVAYQAGYTWEIDESLALGARLMAGVALAEDPLPYGLISLFSELPLG